MMEVAIEHLAGKPDGLVQTCERCGEIVYDNRNVMIDSSDIEGCRPYFWAEGKVYNIGNFWSTREPCENVRPCNPV